MGTRLRAKKKESRRIPAEILERLPEYHLRLYAHLWELESWLREMVYVELVARYGRDWATKIVGQPERARAADSRLRHMPTREKLSTSYILFSQLRKTISRRWVLFREYLPPKEIWDARLNEVEQIRNRVAHFRRGHPDDLDRVRQLLRDIDQGFWRFCTSYNDARPLTDPKADPVAREFAALDPFPWSEVEANTYARIGRAPDDLAMAVTVEYLRRPWIKARQPASVIGHYGYLYALNLTARGSRIFDYSRFLRNTKRLHGDVCHICLDAFQTSLRITVPCVAGVDILLPHVKQIVEEAQNSLRPGRTMVERRDIPAASVAASKAIDRLAMQWPEYVLGPGNPLSFLDPDMPCRFFGAASS